MLEEKRGFMALYLREMGSYSQDKAHKVNLLYRVLRQLLFFALKCY